MQIGSNSLYDIGSYFTIKLNERQTLVIDDDPIAKERERTKETAHDKEKEAIKDKESKKNSSHDELSEDEERLVKDLASRDSDVKAHEAAHQAAAGGLAGPASYTYQQGPDGKMYAIGGEVTITTPASSSPEEAIQNARRLASAALGVGDPSPQDMAVASSAKMMEMQAQQQKAKEDLEKQAAQATYADVASSNNASSKNQKEHPALDFSA